MPAEVAPKGLPFYCTNRWFSYVKEFEESMIAIPISDILYLHIVRNKFVQVVSLSQPRT